MQHGKDTEFVMYVDNFLSIENLESLGVKPEILEISAKHQLDNYSAAILYHSNHVV